MMLILTEGMQDGLILGASAIAVVFSGGAFAAAEGFGAYVAGAGFAFAVDDLTGQLHGGKTILKEEYIMLQERTV